MNTDERLVQLGISLPEPPVPLGAYVPAVQAGNLLFLSGMLPLFRGTPAYMGRVGVELGIEEARAAVRCAVLNALSTARTWIGSLDRIQRVVRFAAYLATDAGFTEHARIADAGSDLLRDIFGDRAAHSRLAFGVFTLPANMPVELEFIFQIDA